MSKELWKRGKDVKKGKRERKKKWEETKIKSKKEQERGKARKIWRGMNWVKVK
jgi:hypothetical protein